MPALADWGDGSINQFLPTGFYNLVGVVNNYYHSYKNPGTFTAKVRCKNIYNLWSEGSKPLVDQRVLRLKL